MSVLRSSMTFRTYALMLVVCGGLLASAASPAHAQLIPRTDALRQGLKRAWFTQVQLDVGRAKVAHVTLDATTLFVQTSAAVLQAIDAETGRTLWARQVGRSEHPSLEPAANEKYVAVANGSRLYVVERSNGQLKWERRLGGAPGAGPALTKTHVFVPMISGRIEAYELEHPERDRWAYFAEGHAYVQPLATPQSVCWPTDRGHLYVCSSENLEIQYRLQTGGAIESPPAYRQPHLFAASLDGFVYALREQNGRERWRFSTGNPIREPSVVIEDHLYVCPDHAGMFCISAEDGQLVWRAPKVTRFLAASPERVFASDRLRRLVILDAKTGARVGSLPTPDVELHLVNRYTDRIYLGTKAGLIQCLHEASRDEPVLHATTAPDAERPAPDGEAAGETGDVDPFGEGEAASGEGDAGGVDDDPFGPSDDGGGAENQDAVDDNPFDF